MVSSSLTQFIDPLIWMTKALTKKIFHFKKTTKNHFNIRHDVRFMFSKKYSYCCFEIQRTRRFHIHTCKIRSNFLCLYFVYSKKKCICFTCKSTKNFKKRFIKFQQHHCTAFLCSTAHNSSARIIFSICAFSQLLLYY